MPADISAFDAVPTQLLEADKRSVLAVREVLGRTCGNYAYLEVGSHLGGSLQPFLLDARCTVLYSVDPRPLRQPDERGEAFLYRGNSTQHMLDTLAPAYGAHLDKLHCFERHVRDVQADELPRRPRLLLIDGEHTDTAVQEDFRACVALAEADCVVMFDDAHVVYRGLRRCLEWLRAEGTPFRAYVLPAKIAVVEVGNLRLAGAPEISELLVTAEAFLFATDELDRYRRMVVALKSLPGVSLVNRVRRTLGASRLKTGGTEAV